MRCWHWGLGRAGDQPRCSAARQGRGAVGEAAVTCMAMLMVSILCFQFGVFLSLVNHSRAGGEIVFNILTELCKVHVLQSRVKVTSQSPKFIDPMPRVLSPAGKATSLSPHVPLPGWPWHHQGEKQGCSRKGKLSY